MFKIDFFELCFLAEACIPPRPIARSMFFENLSEKYYYEMNANERKRIYEWISKLDYFQHSLKNRNDLCVLFECRFNPNNQYRVKCEIAGKEEIYETFKMDNRYHINKSTSIVEEFIKSVENIVSQ